ncbi:ABC transporter substrate-binding protein [Streptomyces sp. TS71-3]|uniref:ABC transporter substrate-binding protein n=1 Tax=Streptomyces sp. TS71-3 TaxID=2733862 RepID=UPI001BB38363|nr:ABC transporter substrate-binding protein [Streptomyces sp. TS71-3]
MTLRKRWPVLAVAAGLTGAFVTGCGSDQGGSGGTGKPLIVGMSDDVLATDPASGYDPGSWLLFNNVFQSLLSFPNGATEPVPEAAKSCTFADSRSMTYRCTLRDGLKFSNGDALTSTDVKFSFDRMMRINDPAGPAVMFPTLDRVDTPDKSTVVFSLKVPDATFPSKIASGAGSIVDHRVYPADKLRTDGKAVGSGPYTLQSFGKKQAVFGINSQYEGTAKVRNSGITLDFFHGGQSKLKQALLKGDVDIAYRGLAAKDIADIQQDAASDSKGIDVIEGSSAEVQHLVFNLNDPVAGKLSVRKAITYLLDRNALIDKVYQNTATPLYSIIPAGIVGHNTAYFDTYGPRPDRDKAKQVLRENGVTGKVKLTLWSTPSRYGPATDEELQTIADQLNASGLFDADMKSVGFDQYQRDINSGKYGVYVKGWVPDYPDPDNFTQPFFGTGNVLGNHYENGTITRDIIPATAASGDRTATTRDYDKLQDIVADELPILPVWQAKQYAVVHGSVYGVENCLDPSTVFRFWELSKD